MENTVDENDNLKQAHFSKGNSAEEELKNERGHYEKLRWKALDDMPAIKCYRVIRAHLRNMVQQDGSETVFEPDDQSLAAILTARQKAIEFADHLLLEIQEAINNGHTDLQLMPTLESSIISLQDQIIVSIYVTVIYEGQFTSVDMTDYEVLQSDEEVIYMPHETQSDFEEMREALNREAHSLKNRYGAGSSAIQLMNFEDLCILVTDHRRLNEKGYVQ